MEKVFDRELYTRGAAPRPPAAGPPRPPSFAAPGAAPGAGGCGRVYSHSRSPLVAFRAITPPVEVRMYIVPPRTRGVLSTVPAGVPRDHAMRNWLTFCR